MTPSDFRPAWTVTQSPSISTTIPVMMAPGCMSRVFRLSSKSSAKLSLMLIPELIKDEKSAHLPHSRQCGFRSYKRKPADLRLVSRTLPWSSGQIAQGDFAQNVFQHLLDRKYRGIQLEGVNRRFERCNRSLGVALVARTD